MSDREPNQQLPEKDRLITRPDPEPLPTAQDPAIHSTPADPKLVPKDGQGANPRRDQIDYTA